ncbi:MAG: nitroreductase family protein [Acidimicrobiia bacterium]|nr:nitroreductase family protein [Acidimicrobiia bacterium]
MELSEALRRRRMVRAFVPGRPVAPEVLDRVLDAGRRVPSAGNSQGLDLVVLEGDATTTYWHLAFPSASARARFRWQGLLAAPVLVVPVVSAAAYAERYAEGDKGATGLGEEAAWSVPYWFVDGGMGLLALLLVAVDEGLGACFFGLFEREEALLGALGVPPGRRALGVVALGHPAPDEPGRSVARPRRPLDEVVHRGRWEGRPTGGG